MKKIFAISLILCLAGFTHSVNCQNSVASYKWKKDSVSIALIKISAGHPEFILWKMNYNPDFKPFFHPVSSPDGTLLTAEAPDDHLWHLGQWFCWKYINKLNYWEYEGDPKKAVSEGRTEIKTRDIKTKRQGEARVVMKILYHPWDKPDEIVMVEKRTIKMSAPEADGSYYFEYDMIFVPLVDVLLDRTPVQTNASGVTWGGYAGLSMRFDQKLSDPKYFSDKRDSVINGEGNPYVAANLKTPEGKTVQLVIVDHPDNPRYPSAWYTINRPNDRFWFFSPALLYHSSMELKAGKPMRLRYKVIMPAVPLTSEQIGQMAEGKRQKLVTGIKK
jgi:hypothetical protein